ncbi:MBL fold metallo-hydrolase [Phreatobacter stygius]|uniref:MBL fold metallo-hydrolase n=1 Tax=Phreatobacter stygius TaxID=1940610 RepID=A0A4D7B038_9HYPH|nr:MBL fold metallo-hydrolase [Phreatobacter stygius]QCI64393.1 MBL fold metallo-hydrolase [Phreatobacter stygius]
MRILRWLAGIVLALVLIAGGAVVYVLNDMPDPRQFSMLFQRGGPVLQPGIRVTFLGVSTLLIDDGETAIMTDGFFTRPGGREVFLGKVEPDRAIIAKSLQRAGVARLAAVIPVHSHYDHAMDAPEVARLTGALLVGSESTANIGRGWGLPESQIKLAADGDTLRFGRFRVRFIAGRHAPTPFTGGEIRQPLTPPARASAYLEGTSYALLIDHGERTLLVNASAGFVPGMLRGRRADVVFLGVGTLGRPSQDYLARYWDETVAMTGARRIVPIHWDNFFLPLDQPLEPVPRHLGGFDVVMAFLRQRSQAAGIDLKLMEAWTTTDPFADLPPARAAQGEGR